MNEDFVDAVFKNVDNAPKVVKMKFKDLLESLEKVNTPESLELLNNTKNKYLNVDTTNWDLNIEETAYSEFIKDLEEMDAELCYSHQKPLVDGQNHLRQNIDLYTVNVEINTRWPKVVKGFSRKEGWRDVSVEDILKYIASDGDVFVNTLSYVKKLGPLEYSKIYKR